MIEFCPDIALLDIRVPGGPGDDVARALTAACPDVRVIFQTGEAHPERFKQAVPGALVLAKPVDFDLLIELMHGL